MLGEGPVGHPDAVEEAFPELEVLEGGGGVAAPGEVGAEGEDGFVAGGSVFGGSVSLFLLEGNWEGEDGMDWVCSLRTVCSELLDEGRLLDVGCHFCGCCIYFCYRVPDPTLKDAK